MNISSAYTLLLQDSIREIGGTGYILRHVRSGAHLFLIDTADTNKVFSIAFKTTPENDTGVAHIMEHSVLCGSEKYPVKDPFMELVKGSLNTFLNALTYPDKTMYPVASVNDRDFRNLMDVYLDAVFHPNIYREEKIFRQEGWHFELEDPESPLQLNGVVYNEMRGAFSNPEDVLERKLLHLLYPHNCYANESGGDPKYIPDLTYEDFLAFHKRYYHPSNSYIYLYGSMDFEERLDYLDREYLSHYDAIDPGTDIPDEPAFAEPVYEEGTYGVSEEEGSNGTFLAYAKVVNGGLDPVESLAFDTLSYALLNAPGAPLKQALLDAGIGTDIYGGYESSLKQPYFRIIAKGGSAQDASEFVRIIEQVLTEQAECRVSRETLRAGIHNNEFSLREADFGRLPKGLIYGTTAYEAWMHDERSAMETLKFDEPLKKVKDLLQTGYFEDLIRTKLLRNPHGAVLVVRPEDGLIQEEDRALEKKLADLKASLPREELERIAEETKALKAYQSEPSPQEDLLKIPLLSIDDIERRPAPFANIETACGGMKAVFHPAVTSGILYVDMYFNIGHIELADFPKLALLKNLLTLISTEEHSYQALANEISLKTGGIGYSVEAGRSEATGKVYEDFVIRAKCLYDEIGDMVSLLREITFRTVFSDTKRIKELLSEMRLGIGNAFVSSGHNTASARVGSYCIEESYENELFRGIEFYRYISDLEEHFDERKDALAEELAALLKKAVRKDRGIISVTCEEQALQPLSDAMRAFVRELPDGHTEDADRTVVLTKKNEAFRTASQVQYVCAGGNFRKHGFSFSGALHVLRSYLSDEYLWINLRVKGGAYGCMSAFARNGIAVFVSYRDPNLQKTLEVFRRIPEHLRTLQIDPRDMTKYIIGTISEFDVPLQPHASGERSFAAYSMGFTDEMVAQERAEILDCTVEDLRSFAPLVEAVLEDGMISAVGNEAKIDAEPEGFLTLTTLGGKKNEE